MRIKLSDSQWNKIKYFLPNYEKDNPAGRPRLNSRIVLEGIIYVLIEDCPWKSAPKIFPSGTSLNDYFRSWLACGLFSSNQNIFSEIGLPKIPQLANERNK